MNYMISVIMPIYNAEKHFERTINSIIRQTIGFENIELILVDDKSTDATRSLIQKYADEYDNIKPLFLEENSGWASVPRNEGIKQSTAEYIMFIDSDDEYDKKICEKFYNTIKTEDCDLVSCNYTSTDNIAQTNINFEFNFKNQIINESEIIIAGDQLLEFDNIFVWNKIFKKSIINENKLSFKETVSEDFIFCIEYLLNANKRIYLKEYYGYSKYHQGKSLSVDDLSLKNLHKRVKIDYYVAELLENNINNPIRLKNLYNSIFKMPITWRIEEIMTLKPKEQKEGLQILYLFEKNIKFESELDNAFINKLNKLLLNKRCKSIIIIFKTSKLFLNSNMSRKIYRILFKKYN